MPTYLLTTQGKEAFYRAKPTAEDLEQVINKIMIILEDDKITPEEIQSKWPKIPKDVIQQALNMLEARGWLKNIG